MRLQLAATALGLRMHPLSQALQEYPEQAKNYNAIHQLLAARVGSDTVQMWTRFGCHKHQHPRRAEGYKRIWKKPNALAHLRAHGSYLLTR